MRKAVFACVAGVLLLVLVPASVPAVRHARARSAASRIQPLAPYDMVHVLLYGYGDGTVSGKISLYDADGTLIADIERSWTAAPSLEFARAQYGTKEFVFPTKIGGERPGSGISLARYYLRKKACLLCGSQYPAEYSRDLWRIARFALFPGSHLLGGTQRMTVNLSQCVPGTEYEVRVGPGSTVTLYGLP